ncbi:MAG: cation:proton antiporter [candidate division NC10 bacterium]|nr:cation:proton antiporter [candidate division NC10 bacterium]
MPLFLGGEGLTFRSDPARLFLAEVGVLILLFDVGPEADVRALAPVGLSSLLIALIGVVVPIVLGWVAATWFLPDNPPATPLFVGVTVRTGRRKRRTR